MYIYRSTVVWQHFRAVLREIIVNNHPSDILENLTTLNARLCACVIAQRR